MLPLLYTLNLTETVRSELAACAVVAVGSTSAPASTSAAAVEYKRFIETSFEIESSCCKHIELF